MMDCALLQPRLSSTSIPPMTTNDTTTTTTTMPAPSAYARVALQAFLEQERVRFSLDRKEQALTQALDRIDLSEGSSDLVWFYAESQKIIDQFEAKRVQKGLV